MIIDNVRTKPEFRRRGCAFGMMRRAIEIAGEHEVDCIELFVATFNTGGIALYQKLGFKRTQNEHQRLILKCRT